jgi:hypothetical protein
MQDLGTVNCNRLQAKMLPAAVLASVLFAAQALAGDHTPGAKPASPIAAWMFAPPLVTSIPPALPQTAAAEFSPRRRGLPDGNFAAGETSVFAPMIEDTSLARRMAESKSQNRVRLLTLWQSRVSSVSLQAGRHGAPTLQWSTPWMHHEGSSRGLFDRLIPISPHLFSRAGRVRAGSGVSAP